MTTSRPQALARVRAAIASSGEPVRALCARHGVPWQAFYRHARRQGWALRKPARRRLSTAAAIAALRALVQGRLERLTAVEPAGPETDRLAALAARTLGRLAGLDKAERAWRDAARRRARAITDARTRELTARIVAISRARPEEAEDDADPPPEG